MEPVRKIIHPRTAGPVDLQLILNPTVNIKVKLQLIQKISDALEECCRTQNYFDNMIFVLLKLLSITDPAFSPENDIFKLRKLILQIIHKVCSSHDKIKNHVQSTMGACLKVIETDNEQCVIYCILIFKEFLTAFKPDFDGCFKAEIFKFLKLIMDMYNNSSTQEKIFNFQKTNDLKVLISTIRLTTTISKNSINYVFIPMGKVSFKVLKELANILKLYYILFYNVQSFKHEIIEFFPVLMNFFNLDIPYKPDYRDLVLDLKHAQVRLLFFFSIFLKDNKDAAQLLCTTLPGRVIGLLSCNVSSDNSSLRTELLSGFESVILIDYKCEFLPFMDKFLDETLITGRSWSLKSVLRPKAYIYIDHLITHMHSKLSLNFLVRVIHLHLSNLLDPTLQPEVQINLCNMVMNILSYIVHRQNQSITNINTIGKNTSLIDLFYRVFQIFIKKLKQFQKFYLSQLDKNNSAGENMKESISSILAEYRSIVKQNEFVFGCHSSQIPLYTIEDSKRFIKIVIPAIRTLFQFIVKTKGDKFSVGHHYKHEFNNFLKYSLLSINVCKCPIQKKEMVKEILIALSCIKPFHLQTLIIERLMIKQIYESNLEVLIFDISLNDETLAPTFGCLIFDFILNNFTNENEKPYMFDLINRLKLNFKLNSNEEMVNEYIYKVIKMLINSLKHSKYPMIHLQVLKTILIIAESAKYEFAENINSVLRCLLSDLLAYHQSLPNNFVVTKNAIAELCLAECLFKVHLHSHVTDLLTLIVYSFQFTDLTLQGLSILEKLIDSVPGNFFDDLILEVRNKIINELCLCVNNPENSISQSALRLLGKCGGFSRSSSIKSYHLNAHDQSHLACESPKIFISFEEYANQFIEIDIGPALNTAVETLIINEDRFIRAHCWNIIKGFLLVSMDCDTSGITTLVPENINWDTYVDVFSNYECHNVKTITDETYIKALTGLMICCADENLKKDSYKYLNQFTKVIICVFVNHFCGNSFGSALKVSPYVLIDAIINVLSNEREKISDIGAITTILIIEELHNIFTNNMLHFPLVEYMFRQFCELCYDSSWICKRAGCSGLHILFVNLSTEDTLIKQTFNWFLEHFLTAFKAMMFIFSDFNRHLTFGVMDIASSNLDVLFNWLYCIKPMCSSTSFNLIQTTILKDLLDNIIGPNDFLREQSIKVIYLMAVQQESTVSNILKPFYKYLRVSIPGKRLFNTYTFKSQIGIMKAHLFCALHSIPAKKLDFSNRKHTYYFNFLCNMCKCNYEGTKKMKIFKDFTSQQVHEFCLTAINVLANCHNFLVGSNKLKVFQILLSALKSSDQELQETAYHCLQLCSKKLTTKQTAMVDKILFYFAKLFQNNANVTLVNTRYILYLSKLYPSRLNKKFCTILMNTFKSLWDNLHHCKNKTSTDELQLTLKNILETMSIITEIEFFHIKNISETILNEEILNINWCNTVYALLTECLLKFPEDCIDLFFQEQNLINSIWSSFFNSMIINKNSEILRNLLTFDSSRLENLFTVTKIDQSKTIRYETIKIIYNLVKMDKKWIATKKKLIGILLNNWANPQYKERYKNLASIKSTEWNEPKMLIKIVLEYFKANNHEVCILFQILSVFSYKFPFDTNFFRHFLENEVIKSYTIQWKRGLFFKFIDLYQKKGVNSDILGKILQYLILPCFSLCYKNGEEEKLLCTQTKSNDNIIGIILSKMFTNIRIALTGCDIDGIKVSLCQLICLLLKELLLFKEDICDIIYNSIISCTWVRCTMDINVKFHCYLILTSIMLSGNASKREKLNQGIYYELLKASSAEAQPVINHSLNLIVSAVRGKENEQNNDINTLVVCIRKIMMTESQNVPTLHHICSFLIKYHTLFYPYKQFLIRNILGSLFPIAKNNNVPEFKKTAIELSCMIINWELADDEENMKLKFPLKRKMYDTLSTMSKKKKSSETIDNCLNFLAMVGCQTHDDKPESRISKLAVRSATLFKNILSTEPIDTKEVKLKFGWIEKLLDTFLKKENIIKQNPYAHGNTNASLMNLLTTFDIMSFLLNVLSQKLMLEALKPLQEHLMKFLQLAFDEKDTLSYFYNHLEKDISIINRLSDTQIKQYNEGTIKFLSCILKTFPSNDGLEKLHLFIQMIISEGLNSDCSHKLGISLSLLKVSSVHFPNYIDNDVLNTLGDILFKFNKNNENPLIKVECLEILKTHVDSLPRVGKQVFIEKVIMENLNKARDFENSIPLDVQIKCFQLVITYIKDLSEANERMFLNSTLMQYIKTTTDEQIMIVILNFITKWIEICRDEAVFFNCQIIDILKYITTHNRFPQLSNYCYILNLEIYKNWHSHECIKFGLDCKIPTIRFEFLHFHNSLWQGDSGLCSRLYTIMSDELSYGLEFSLAFYVQVLLVNVSKNTKLLGDFSLLDTKPLFDNYKMLAATENFNSSLYSILSLDMCSSLVQLCFVDVNLAKTLWISLLPNIWSLFSDIQRNSLSTKSVHFLTNSKLRNNFMTTFYEAVILCKPKINFEPYQVVYIGKTYNLWYEAINQMEDVCNYYEHNKKNESIEGMIQMYSLLREEDILDGLFQNTLICKNTKKAFAIEQQGCFEKASQIYAELLKREGNDTKDSSNNSYNKEKEFRRIHLTKCLRELNQWDTLSQHTIKENDFMLNIETAWKKSIENSTSHNLKWYLEHEQKIWPSKLNWKYHFYMGMLNLNILDEQVISSVKKHVELSFEEIAKNWKSLPKFVCNAHTPLLQATQLLVEMKEVCEVQNTRLLTPQSTNYIDSLINLWNNRKPWIGDDLSAWNDLISWRQTYYSFLISDDINLKLLHAKSALDQSKLVFAEIALKHNMIDVCINTLKSMDPNNVDTCNLLQKMYLETKCVQKNINYSTKINNMIHLPLKNDLMDDIMSPLILLIRGSYQDYSGNTEIAFKYFTEAFLNRSSKDPCSVDWQCVIENNFNMLSHKAHKFNTDNQKPLLNNFLTVLNYNEILKNGWLQWAKLIQNEFNRPFVKDINIALAAMKCYVIASKLTNNINCNIIVAKILWLLTYDDDNCTLLRTFEKCHITFSDLWIPQILNTFIEKNASTIKKIILKIGKLCPQKMYLTLNRMYLAEKMDSLMEKESPPSNIEKSFVKTFISTKNMKIDKIKQIMRFLRKCNLGVIHELGLFVNQVAALGESRDEEIRRNLYECLYLSYDWAFENKNLNVNTPKEISDFIETILILFIKDVDSDKLKMDKFTTFDNLSKYDEFLMEKFVMDFRFEIIPTIGLVIKQLKKWISYFETQSNFPSKFGRKLHCSSINSYDWSMIKLPNENYYDDTSCAIRIHNFSSHMYVKDKFGTVVKQITVRGTNGLLYTYNVFRGQDIESEERIFQLFHIANNYLLNFKETTKRFLKLFVPKTFIIAPHICMIETNSSMSSLFEVYKEMMATEWVHDDIEYWFSVLNTSIITERASPLMESFFSMAQKYNAGDVMKNWALLNYPVQSDYWTFRKTFIEHYSVLCFFEYAFNLIKVKPEMLYICQNNGMAVVLQYKFLSIQDQGNLVQRHILPFRLTPSLLKFITPYRKHQFINCLNATNQCLNNSIEDITSVLKLLLRDELNRSYNVSKNGEKVLSNNYQIIEIVNRNLNCITKNFKELQTFSTQNSIQDLVEKALHDDLLCHESPTWRPWL